MKHVLLLIMILLGATAVIAGGPDIAQDARTTLVDASTWTTLSTSITTLQGAITAIDAHLGTLGSMALATETEYARLDRAASFTARIDFNSSSPSNFTATPTIAGEDVFGNINSALEAILGE